MFEEEVEDRVISSVAAPLAGKSKFLPHKVTLILEDPAEHFPRLILKTALYFPVPIYKFF